jgi:hypothetical protein
MVMINSLNYVFTYDLQISMQNAIRGMTATNFTLKPLERLGVSPENVKKFDAFIRKYFAWIRY